MAIVTHAEVLYMEDDESLAWMVKKRLRRAGIKVELARDGREGLARLAKKRYDVVLVDYKMPHKDGLTTLRELFALDAPPPPAIMVSGGTSLEVAVEAMKMGAADYVIKDQGDPFIELLISTIGRILENRKLLAEKKRAEEALRYSETLLRTTLDSTQDGILVLDKAGKITHFNRVFSEIWQCPTTLAKAPTAQEIFERIRDQVRNPKYFCTRWKITSQQDFFSLVCQDGRVLECFSRPLLGGNELEGRVWSFLDVTERKKAEEKIRRLAMTDSLTGLANRNRFNERLTQALEDAKRYGRGGALLLIDLDKFKPVNDTYGHLMGDKVLQHVAKILLQSVRKVDTVARIGGDEFAIILHRDDSREAASVPTARIITLLAQVFTINRQEIKIGGSAGIAFYPSSAEDAEALLNNADKALYQAKDAGRNTFKFYHDQ